MLLISLSLVLGQGAYKPVYEMREDHDPNGIGVFYMGREIAMVMGHQAADWLERPERYAEEAPQLLLKGLNLKPGMIVGDVGAGSGYLSFPMAKQVAPNGKVYAQDIQQEMLDIVAAKSKRLGVKNVIPWLGTTDNTKLPDGTIDLILMVDVYHEFDKPYEMALSMTKALKKGGKLVFVEYRKEDRRVPIKEVHKMSEEQVKKEMSVLPLKWVSTNSSLPRQHMIFFEKL